MRQARREADLHQTEVAERIGTHSVTVSNWEHGQEMDLNTLWRLAGIYRKPVGWLAFGDDAGGWPPETAKQPVVVGTKTTAKRVAKRRAAG